MSEADTSPHDALLRVIEIVGGQTALARALGVSQTTVHYWARQSRRGVPGEYVLEIEKLARRKVTRCDLRPDIYPRRKVA